MSVPAAPTGEQRNDGGPAGCHRQAGLSRRHRLRRSALFRETFERGSRQVGRLMVLWLRRGDGADLRLGVVASKRVFRRAVDRSKVKRRLREAYRLNRGRLSGKVDVVLIARRGLLAASHGEAEADLLRCAGRAGILRADRPKGTSFRDTGVSES